MGFLSGFSKDAVITLDEGELPMPDKEGFFSLGAFWLCNAALTFSLLTLVGVSCFDFLLHSSKTKKDAN